MKTIKLTETQNQKLATALKKEGALKEQLRTASAIYNDASKNRQDIFELIANAHGIDLRLYDQQEIKYNDGEIILKEKAAKPRVKKLAKR